MTEAAKHVLVLALRTVLTARMATSVVVVENVMVSVVGVYIY